MAQKKLWDFALRIKGTTPKSIPLSVLAEFLQEFSAILGEKNKPKFAGVTKGSALLRAHIPYNHIQETRIRLLEAKQGTGSAATIFDNIIKLVTREQTTATIEDSSGAIILEFKSKSNEELLEKEYVIHDTGAIDGEIIGITGADDTVHIKIQEQSGAIQKIVVRDLDLAKKLATHFRSGLLRIEVHGTWKRSSTGVWEPLSIYGDSFVELEDTGLKDVFNNLAKIEGNGWASLDDPIGEWKDIRGID